MGRPWKDGRLLDEDERKAVEDALLVERLMLKQVDPSGPLLRGQAMHELRIERLEAVLRDAEEANEERKRSLYG